ncbi:MAG: glycosyl hydrolase [Clostridia bacterium]|nr:glycosyl hydrolase [Clostridia bacterium]
MHSSVMQIPSGLWSLSFRISEAADDGLLLELKTDALTLAFARTGGYVSIHLETVWDVTTEKYGENPKFCFLMNTGTPCRSVRLDWLDSVIRLYADGKLADEEWPLGRPVQGECSLFRADCVSELSIEPLTSKPADGDIPLSGPAQFYMPPYHNASVGDCMPFVSGGRYRLYHLFDRKHHQSKMTLGAHQWAQISSGNLIDWTLHPIAVGVDEQWEGSICTGSMIEHEGKIYAFYAVRMSDGSPAKLSWAVSEDGVHFKKSGQYFSLSAPYEPVSARDPKVFKDPDGLYHMLVTTSILDGRTRPGCLAHLTSRDLINWTQHKPFLVPGYPGQPECSDYFEWNGYYYISFANNLNARYRISKQPFGPWMRPKDDIVVSPNLAVPKMALFNGRCLASGWLGDGAWGGWAITYELFQREDGSLGVKFIEEMMPDLNAPRLHPVCADASNSYAEELLAECENPFRVRGTVAFDNPGAAGELILSFGEAEYRIAFDPLEKTVSFYEPKDRPLDVNARSRLINVKGMDKPFDIDLVVHDRILMLLLPDGQLLLPSRLEHSGPCRLSASCRDGQMRFTPRT